MLQALNEKLAKLDAEEAAMEAASRNNHEAINQKIYSVNDRVVLVFE